MTERKEKGTSQPGAFDPSIRRGLLGLALIGPVAVLLALDPILQDAAYHHFADARAFWGVPNLLDVASNLALLVVGALGLLACRRRAEDVGRSWWVFFAGVSFVSVGSAYYHWEPTDATLVWDRLPIAVCFSCLLVAMLAEHVDPRAERLLLLPGVAVAVASVLYWQHVGDLRPYVWVTFTPVLAIPAALLLFRSRYTRAGDLWLVLALFVVARVVEVQDHLFFQLTGGVVSGHTLKHLVAAGAVGWTARMVWLRTAARG